MTISMAEGTEVLEVTLRKPGSYVFYCDKFLHRWPFGMEGGWWYGDARRLRAG